MNKEVILSYWKDKISQQVLEAFAAVPREEFVLQELRNKAYEDKPLPILREKTISQPSTVLVMTESLGLGPGMKVLEIGAGSGYQAALAGWLVGEQGEVLTTEVVPELVHFARNNLARLGINNVTVVEHDGSQGYAEKAPYDRIIITAAAPSIPPHLIEQLKPEGIILAPVGDVNMQHMIRLVKRGTVLERHDLGEFIFSPMVGKFGFDEEKVT